MKNPHKPKHVVVVEDNRLEQVCLEHMVCHHYPDCKVTTLHDGAQLFDYLAGKGVFNRSKTTPHPDMIILDLYMPEMDGLEVLTRLRSQVEYKDIPVILVTACTADQTLMKAYKSGANAFVPKPVQAYDLVLAMQGGGNFAPHHL